MDVLTIGRNDGEVNDDDGQSNPGPERVERQPTERQHKENLLCRIGIRGQGVAREHRERYPLWQKGVLEAVAAKRSADKQALGAVR